MKKLLLFSILFLTCSLGLKSVKAEYCNDGEMIEIPNIFDTETHNFYKDYGNYGLSFSDYKERYTQSYNDLVDYIKSNYKYYFFSAQGVFMWNEEGLAVYIVAYSLQETNANYINFTISYTDTEKGQLTDNKAKFYKYSSLKNGFDQTKNSQFYGNFNDWYPIVRYGSSGTSPFKNLSGCNGETTPNYYYSAGLNTNADVIIASESYGRKLIANQTERFYKKIKIGDKVYSDGDYINVGKTSVDNPKISFQSLTTTGDETGKKIGVTATVDFHIFDNSTKYQYLLSFDHGKTWNDVRLAMTSSVYTFSRLENFEVIAQLFDSETGKRYYTTGLVDNIDMTYHSRWLNFERDDTHDEYTIFNGVNYLTKTTINVIEKYNQLNGYPLKLYYSRDGSHWELMPHKNAHFAVHSNNATYFLYRDQSNNTVFRSTYTASYFKETSLLGEIINFDEEQPTDDSYVVYVTFVNYREDHFYWIKEQDQDYTKLNMKISNGMHKWTTQEKKTYCARITEDSEGTKVIKELCHTTTGIRIVEDMDTYVDSTIDFINEQRNKLEEISSLLKRMYEGLPTLIKNFLVFSYFLFCMSCIIWNIRK